MFIQNIKGCEDTVVVDLQDPPAFEVEIGDDQTVDFGQSFRVTSFVNLPGNFTFEWSGADSIVCLNSECTEIDVFAFNPGELMIQATNEFGCTAIDLLQIDVRKTRPLFAPTAFSPNGDATNDRWTLFGPTEVVQGINYIRIFDRWGVLAWQGNNLTPNDVSQGWDGRMNGEELNPAVFAFVAEVLYVDGEALVVSGDINLIK